MLISASVDAPDLYQSLPLTPAASVRGRVRDRDGAPVRLKDIADIEDGLSDFRQLARFNGSLAVGLGTVKIPNTNTVEIIRRIQERLDNDIIPNLPPGMRIDVVQNDSVFIREIINSLKEHLFEGTLLASLVVLFFLRSVRSTMKAAMNHWTRPRASTHRLTAARP